MYLEPRVEVGVVVRVAQVSRSLLSHKITVVRKALQHPSCRSESDDDIICMEVLDGSVGCKTWFLIWRRRRAKQHKLQRLSVAASQSRRRLFLFVLYWPYVLRRPEAASAVKTVNAELTGEEAAQASRFPTPPNRP